MNQIVVTIPNTSNAKPRFIWLAAPLPVWEVPVPVPPAGFVIVVTAPGLEIVVT